MARRRARLVAKGFRQVPGVSYDKLYALVAKYTSLQFILVLKALRGLETVSLNVKNSLLSREIREELHIDIPEENHEDIKRGNCFRLKTHYVDIIKLLTSCTRVLTTLSVPFASQNLPPIQAFKGERRYQSPHILGQYLAV